MRNIRTWRIFGYLVKRGTTWKDLKWARKDLKRPTTTYNKTWSNPKRERHNLKWPKHTYNVQRKDAKRPTASRFSDYFTIWGKRFSSLTRFPLDIWLQSFEHFFTKNDGENRASSIYYHASSVNYHVYFLRDIRFIFFCLGFVSAGKWRGYYFSSLSLFHPLRKSFHLQRLHSRKFNDERGLRKRIQEPHYIFLLSTPLQYKIK